MAASGRRAATGRPPRLSPTRVREAMRRGALYARTGRLAEARDLYRTVLAAKPDHQEALKAAALVAFRLDGVDEAVALLQRAVALDTGDAGARNDLGNVLQAAGHVDAALAAYRRAVEIDPERAETHVNLGQALRLQGDLDGAAEALARAAGLRPGHAGTMLRIGLVHHAKGRSRRGRAELSPSARHGARERRSLLRPRQHSLCPEPARRRGGGLRAGGGAQGGHPRCFVRSGEAPACPRPSRSRRPRSGAQGLRRPAGAAPGPERRPGDESPGLVGGRREGPVAVPARFRSPAS